MKTIITASYSKYAKDNAEDFDVNPWAVCHTTVDKEEDPEKYEKCVKEVKQKHRKKSNDEWLRLLEAKEDDKWIQDAVKKPGSFTEYCGGKVTDECVEKGKKSDNKKTKQRAELAETFRGMSKKKK